MPVKEGTIFITVSCPHCGCVMQNGWSYVPKEGDKTTWEPQCPVCHFPIKVIYEVQ